MPEGFLRESVGVAEAGDYIALSHPCWTLELPRDWVTRTAGVMDFLSRRKPLGDHLSSEAADLGRLLLAQGCLTYSEDRASYSLREIGVFFHGIRNEWCGHYYRQPLWGMLRTGALAKPRFIAWAVYNYFLSRSAGISASRFVAFTGNIPMRAPLARSMIEEYSHFSDYYHIRHKVLDIPQREIEDYVQLPSSTAFCQQMLRMAEQDWLGHVLIAYFQESTVQFYRECFDFYSQVEDAYGLDGFFAPWRNHIQVDIDCLHAESIGEMFDSDEQIAIGDLRHSLANAWFAYRALLTALDEIAFGPAEVNGEWRRRPIRTIDDLSNTILLADRGISPAPPAAAGPASLLNLSAQLTEAGWAAAPAQAGANDRDCAFLRTDILASVYRALSFADEAALILALGKLAEAGGAAFAETDGAGRPRHDSPNSAEAMAIANFLREMAATPGHFCFALHCLAGPEGDARAWLPPVGPAGEALSQLLAAKPADAGGPLLTKMAQLLELVARWEGRADLRPTPNFFTGSGLAAQPAPHPA